MKEFSRKDFELLTTEYAGINLTRINEYDEFEVKQIHDSIVPYEESTVFKTYVDKLGINVDIGFGGGFPILPLAKILPENKFVGIETRNKKCKVVGEIAGRLGIMNVGFIHSRIEDVLIDRKCVCTFKAVGKVNDFLSKINTTEDIVVFFYKGPGFYEQESEQLELAKKNWEVIENIELNVPGTEKRLLIGFKNKSVLRGTKNTKQLVKLSSIL